MLVLALDCVGLLRTGAAKDFTVAGIARKLAEACAEAVFAGHDEAAGAAGQALALAALQQPARHEVLLECVLLIHGVEAVNHNVLGDHVSWSDGQAGIFQGT